MALAPDRSLVRTMLQTEARIIERFDAMHERLQPMVFRDDHQPPGLHSLLRDLVTASGDATGACLALARRHQVQTTFRGPV